MHTTLFEFMSQSKVHVVYHHFCAYCEAYFGKDEGNRGGAVSAKFVTTLSLNLHAMDSSFNWLLNCVCRHFFGVSFLFSVKKS